MNSPFRGYSPFSFSQVETSDIETILGLYSVTQISARMNVPIKGVETRNAGYQSFDFSRYDDYASLRFANPDSQRKRASDLQDFAANSPSEIRPERQRLQHTSPQSPIHALLSPVSTQGYENRAERLMQGNRQNQDLKLQSILVSFLSAYADTIASLGLTAFNVNSFSVGNSAHSLNAQFISSGRHSDNEKSAASQFSIGTSRPEKVNEKHEALSYGFGLVNNSVIQSLDKIGIEADKSDSLKLISGNAAELHNKTALTPSSSQGSPIDSRQRELAKAGVEILMRDSRDFKGKFPDHYYERISRELFEKALANSGGNFGEALDTLNRLSGNRDWHIGTAMDAFLGTSDVYDTSYQRKYESVVGTDSSNGWDKVRHFTGTANSQYDSNGFLAPELFTYCKEILDEAEHRDFIYKQNDPEGYSISDISADNRGEAFGEELQAREGGLWQDIKDFAGEVFSVDKQSQPERSANEPKPARTLQPVPQARPSTDSKPSKTEAPPSSTQSKGGGEPLSKSTPPSPGPGPDYYDNMNPPDTGGMA